jgi:hypothetical protein
LMLPKWVCVVMVLFFKEVGMVGVRRGVSVGTVIHFGHVADWSSSSLGRSRWDSTFEID